MQRGDLIYQQYIQILQEELRPAMGCTEPIALALAGAKARQYLGRLPDQIRLNVSGNIIKNVKSVVVPNTGGLHGMEAAVCVGIVAGDPDRELQVISSVPKERQPEIRDYLDRVDLKICPSSSGLIFDIDLTIRAGEDWVRLRIVNNHTNIVYIEKNGQVILNLPVTDSPEDALTDKSCLNVRSIVEFADALDIRDIEDSVGTQIRENMEIAQEGLDHNWGANIGSVILKHQGATLSKRACAYAAAGSDARMSGCEKPVIIVSGSGNQGITASVPVAVYARELGCSRDLTMRAVALSDLITLHQKSGIGRLSAYCGAISAGCGAGAGIAYLLGGGYDAISHTVVNAIAILSGTICDGAKPSCAAKIAAAVDAGVLGYHMYLDQQEFVEGDGIVTRGVDQTVHNVGRLAREGMRETDRTILDIMLHGC